MGAPQKFAEIEYYENNWDRASFLMCRAYSFESLVDYLKLNDEELTPRTENETILYPLTEIPQAGLVQFMKQRFSSECNSCKNNIIKQYMEVKGDRDLIQKLIDECGEKITMWEKMYEKDDSTNEFKNLVNDMKCKIYNRLL